MTLPNDTLITEDQLQATEDEEWKMARVVWPDELRRYSVEEIIARAQRRLDEYFYHPMKNNCESSVMWCLCDLNISPQANRMRKAVFETGVAIFSDRISGNLPRRQDSCQASPSISGRHLRRRSKGRRHWTIFQKLFATAGN